MVTGSDVSVQGAMNPNQGITNGASCIAEKSQY